MKGQLYYNGGESFLFTSSYKEKKIKNWGFVFGPWGFPGGTSGKELSCIKKCKFNPWVGKIPWRRVWQPTPVFLPGESPWTEGPGGL